jgi:hypothetical protein
MINLKWKEMEALRILSHSFYVLVVKDTFKIYY